FYRVAGFCAPDRNRSVKRVIVAALTRCAFEGGIKFGRYFFLRHTEALEVARVAGGGPKPHDIARIDRKHGFQRGIKEAAVYRGGRRSQLMDFFGALRGQCSQQQPCAETKTKGV